MASIRFPESLRAWAALALCLSLSLAGCLSFTAHENFKNHMQWNVGKSADDADVTFNRYPERRGTLRSLPNGNREQEWVYRNLCRAYFEIDATSRKIIDWRFEGNPDVCTVPL